MNSLGTAVTRGGRWRTVWLPALYFCGLVVFMTWPLGAHLASAVIGGKGDNLYYVWLIGWFREALFRLGLNPLFVPMHNSPFGWDLAYTEITFSNVIIALPISLIDGPTLGYNFALLVSFVLSGLIVYWWVVSITQSKAAGLVAGTLFAFAPYRIAHAYGHLPLMGTQWLALHYMGLHQLLQRRPPAAKYAALAGLGLGLAALSSMYYLYMTLVVSTLYVVGYLILVERKGLLRLTFWRNLAAAGLIALPLLVAAAFPFVQLAMRDDGGHYALAEVEVWSASPTDFLLPLPVQFIWGKWVASVTDRTRWIESGIYVGGVTLILVAAAILGRKCAAGLAVSVRLLSWATFCALVLAMGVGLHWLGRPVSIGIPGPLQGWAGRSQVFVPLPGRLLFDYLPFYDGMRSWMRYGIYVNLFAATMAAIGYTVLSKMLRAGVLRQLLLIVTVVFIIVDFYPGLAPLSDTEPRSVDAWLGTQPGNGAVVQFPIGMSSSPEVVYGTIAYSKPFLGMFYGARLPSTFLDTLPTLQRFPDEESVKLLRERGVEFVVVDSSRYPEWLETKEKIEAQGLAEKALIYDQHVFEFTPP